MDNSSWKSRHGCNVVLRRDGVTGSVCFWAEVVILSDEHHGNDSFISRPFVTRNTDTRWDVTAVASSQVSKSANFQPWLRRLNPCRRLVAFPLSSSCNISPLAWFQSETFSFSDTRVPGYKKHLVTWRTGPSSKESSLWWCQTLKITTSVCQ